MPPGVRGANACCRAERSASAPPAARAASKIRLTSGAGNRGEAIETMIRGGPSIGGASTAAALISTAGGALGLLAGMGLAGIIRLAIPGLPVRTPAEYVVLALAVSFAVGLLSGILPARRAARLNAIEALAAE